MMHLPSALLTRSIWLLLALWLASDPLSPTAVTALQLGSRRQSSANVLIARARLQERGNCCSQPDDPDPPPNYGAPYPSDPSVDDLKADIVSLGTVAGKRSIFYTSLGGINGQDQVAAWACAAIDSSGAGFVIFRTLIPEPYIMQKLVNIATSAASIDLWGKRASWAWAELAEGDTYLAIPEGVNAAADSTWTLYEYPALQRNGNINHIIRVDPNTAATSTIWTQGTDPTDTPEPGPQHRSGPPV